MRTPVVSPTKATPSSRKVTVVYTPGHASHHVSYFDNEEGVAFVCETTGVRIEGHPYVMPATPPPDIDLDIWDTSFAAILERKPARLFLTHFGFSENPSEHIMLFRERLYKWVALTEKIIQSTSSESAAMDAFMTATYAEIAQYLPADEVEHYAFSAGLNLSFLGLARYLRKRASAAPCTALCILLVRTERSRNSLAGHGNARRPEILFRMLCVWEGTRLRGRFRGRHFRGTRRRFWGWRRQRCKAGRKRFGQQINKFFCAAATGIFVGIVLRHVQPQKILVFCEFRKGGADLVEAQPAAAGHVHGGKIFLSDDIEIEMKHELTRIDVNVRQRFLRGHAAALELDVPGIDMPHRRAGQEVVLRRIQSLEPEERHVRLADKRRLAPEAHQFRRALAADVGHHHSINAAGRSACRSIQIGVAIEPQQVHMLVVAPRAGQ